MGGSSTGSSRGGGGRGFPVGFDCDDLEIKTQLSSPVAEVIINLVPGDELILEMSPPTGPCEAIFKGKIAGTIISKDLQKIIECIVKGHRFVAIVRSVSGARCAVTIKNINAL